MMRRFILTVALYLVAAGAIAQQSPLPYFPQPLDPTSMQATLNNFIGKLNTYLNSISTGNLTLGGPLVTGGALTLQTNAVAINSSASAGYLNASPGLALTTTTTSTFGLSISPAVSGEPYVELDGYGTGNDPFITMFYAGGTASSPTAALSGATLSSYGGGGFGAGNLGAVSSNVTSKAAETFSTGHAGTTGLLQAIDTVTETLTAQLQWGGAGGVQIGASPTGGAKGNGTLNVAGLYYANGTAGVSGSPTAGFVSVNGIVTHC